MKQEKNYPYCHTEEEKQYCLNALIEIDRQIPKRYASLVQLKLQEQGINDYDTVYIQRVRNRQAFNRHVVEAFQAITRIPRIPKVLKRDPRAYLLNKVA